MSSEREVTRIVRSWLEEGVTALPDRVLDAVLDQVPATPQRRPLWPPRRFSHMNNPFRLAIAAAAVLAVALVGYQFLPSNTGTGAPPTASPTPTAAPTVAPTPASTTLPLLPGAGSIDAGRYRVLVDGRSDLGIAIDVPGGWEGCCSWPGWVIFNGEPTPTGAAILVGDVTTAVVYGDPCHWSSSTSSDPRGAEAIAAAVAAQPGRQGTQPLAVTVGGLPGFHVRLSVPNDLATTTQADGDATFVDCDEGEYRTLEGRWHQGLSQVDDFYFVDIGTRTVVFDIFSFPGTSAADMAALEAMLASVQID